MRPLGSQVVLVTGAPGAGKSTVAAPLASALGFPLLAKDTIKEALFDALGDGVPTLEESRRLGAAAFEVMWAVAKQMPSVMLEANFRPGRPREREELSRISR